MFSLNPLYLHLKWNGNYPKVRIILSNLIQEIFIDCLYVSNTMLGNCLLGRRDICNFIMLLGRLYGKLVLPIIFVI